MTAHELAAKLLAGPDHETYVVARRHLSRMGDFVEISKAREPVVSLRSGFATDDGYYFITDPGDTRCNPSPVIMLHPEQYR